MRLEGKEVRIHRDDGKKAGKELQRDDRKEIRDEWWKGRKAGRQEKGEVINKGINRYSVGRTRET